MHTQRNSSIFWKYIPKYPEIWAPYYTLDKIMSDYMIVMYLPEMRRQKEILDLMGDWVYDRLSRLPKRNTG